MSNKQFPEYSMKNLLAKEQYLVPRYQRNFAWTEEHIKQLIDDVLDSYSVNKEMDKNIPYYLGTLVVYPRKSVQYNHIYEVIDGQQRLTTLTLIASYLTYKERSNSEITDHWYNEINLDFESRDRSIATLKAAHNGVFEEHTKKTSHDEVYTIEIQGAYEIIQRLLPIRCKEYEIDQSEFADHFFEKVKICRVDVPGDTDLNHYFEIMNNRGEQLEKHEVLKARLLNKLNNHPDRFAFNQIWEACAEMDKYIQYCFPMSIRKQIFGRQWNSFETENSEELFSILAAVSPQNGANRNDESAHLQDVNARPFQLSEIISNPRIGKTNTRDESEDEPERFSPIVNFPNFLLHTLSIFLEDGDVALDDKQLLENFNKLENSRIKEFGYSLLKTRFLFDLYIIKRDATEDEREWSLKELHLTYQGNPSYRNTFSKKEEDSPYELQQKITLLQSMFHVSVPSRPYKYWLQGTLRYLFHQPSVEAEGFKDYLFEMARAFVYDRFLASSPLDYKTLIFSNNCKSNDNSQLDLEKTRYGNIENILVFNFLDYLLWVQHEGGNSKIREFVFTFRSSVEHYYPQNPINGERLKDLNLLHSIGNLCLISHSKNSILKHHLPKAKAEYYVKTPYIDSVKQFIMMNRAERWSQDPLQETEAHRDEMFELLKKYNA